MVEEQASEKAFIHVEIDEDSVTYDTNLSATDVVFWVEAMKSMVITETLQGR